VDGLIKMMNSSETGPINLGNPIELTVKELCEKVIELTNSKSEMKYLDLPIDDPKTRRPDISKAKKLLDFVPKVSLEDGLLKTISYFK
jgi:nucleoside-diphosphate-sugar epimerase